MMPLGSAAEVRVAPLNRSNAPARRRQIAILVWAITRLPLLAILVYALRYDILNVIERQFDILSITRFVIDVLSTPLARLVTGVLVAVALHVVVIGARRYRPAVAYLLTLGASGAVIMAASRLVGSSPRRGVLVWMILAANLLPINAALLSRRLSRFWTALMLGGVGVVELLHARQYWSWLGLQVRSKMPDRLPRWAPAAAFPGVLVASLAFAVLCRGERLLPLEQRLRLSANASVVERGLSFNWIQLDRAREYLYVTGHSLRHLRRYSVRNLSAPPLQSNVATGGAQGFAYHDDTNEIFAFNTYTRRLLYFDAATLVQSRAVEIANLSPGDPWVVVDGAGGTLTVVSEADAQVGVPFVVIDRSSGRVLAQEDFDAGNVLMHPTQPWVYLTFFRRRNEVLLYDVEARMIRQRAPADPRAERMAFWKARNELLVTSPMESRVMRFDADRLQPKGHISTLFGVRAIALDETRQLLLCGNIATGHMVVIDLQSEREVTRQYLGPWLRTIELDVERGIAYVSSNGALYRVAYAAPLQQSHRGVTDRAGN